MMIIIIKTQKYPKSRSDSFQFKQCFQWRANTHYAESSDHYLYFVLFFLLLYFCSVIEFSLITLSIISKKSIFFLVLISDTRYKHTDWQRCRLFCRFHLFSICFRLIRMTVRSNERRRVYGILYTLCDFLIRYNGTATMWLCSFERSNRFHFQCIKWTNVRNSALKFIGSK